jgi:hypothetical protein
MREAYRLAAVLLTLTFTITTANAQSLPSGGVLVQGINGLRPDRLNPQYCMPESLHRRVRCVLAPGQGADVTFIYNNNKRDGCTFHVSNVGKQLGRDEFRIVRVKDDFKRPCLGHLKSERLLEVLPTH